MSGSRQLFEALQAVAKQTIDAHKPSDVLVGEVVSESPLEIMIEQNDVLSNEFLFLTDAVRDYEVDIEVSHITEKRSGGSGDPAFESHDHDYKGRKKIKVYNGLKVGEKVVMVRQGGGQDYLVVSRILPHQNLSGEWR